MFNPFFPNAPFLYAQKTSKNHKAFWCFQEVEKGCIGNNCVKELKLSLKIVLSTQTHAPLVLLKHTSKFSHTSKHGHFAHINGFKSFFVYQQCRKTSRASVKLTKTLIACLKVMSEGLCLFFSLKKSTFETRKKCIVCLWDTMSKQ